MSSELSGIAGSGYPAVDATLTGKKSLSPASAPSAPAIERQRPGPAKTLQSDNQSVQFVEDEATGKMVLSIIDVNTKEVIRQIPSEEVLEIAKSLDRMRGLLIIAKA